MSILNDIKVSLDIQKNIILEENGGYIKNDKGSTSIFVTAKLTYTPTHCEKCDIKNGTNTLSCQCLDKDLKRVSWKNY